MQEIIIDILLGVVIIAAAVLLCVVGTRKDGMTKKQRTMMIRILVCSTVLLGLQFVTAEMFNSLDKFLFPSAGRWIRFACYLADYFIIGYDILKKAVRVLKTAAYLMKTSLWPWQLLARWPWRYIKMVNISKRLP